jgi:hypothetical protein
MSGSVAIAQTDFSQNPASNNTGPVTITKVWDIPAGDMQAGTIYEVQVPFIGTFEAQTLTLAMSIDGSGTNLATAVVGATDFSAGTSFGGTFTLWLQVVTPGVSGTVNCFSSGGLGARSNIQAGSGSNSVSLNGSNAGVSLNTTADHTLRVNATWGSAAAGQLVTGYGSKFTRTGP